jgi:PAS domain-containing protein
MMARFAYMNQIKPQYNFLSSGGEMGQLMRDFDWASTSIGEPSTWPTSLRTAVRLLLSSSHVYLVGPNLIQFYNGAYKRSIGSERHPQCLGQPGRPFWEEIWHIIGPQIEHVLSGAGSVWCQNELVPITRNGKREDVYWTYAYNPIDFEEAVSGVGGVLVICTETTEQVIAEQQKDAAEKRWRELFGQAPGFMCVLKGPDHVLKFANPKYYDLVGRRDLVGKKVKDALPEVQAQGFIELLNNVYRSGEPYTGQGIALTLLRGTREEAVYVDFVYQPITNASGEVTGIFVDGFEVTDRVLAANALQENVERKDEFIAMLAHELRNPLAPIKTAGELLAAPQLGYFDTQGMGLMIGRQVDQLSRLIDDLLDVSRIPDISGYDVAIQLRSSGEKVAIIAVLGYGRPEDKAKALDLGFNGHLTTPVNIADLEALICAHLLLW